MYKLSTLQWLKVLPYLAGADSLYFDNSVQDCGISNADAQETPQINTG